MEEAGPFQIIPYFMGGAPKLTLFVSTSNRNQAEKMNKELQNLIIFTTCIIQHSALIRNLIKLKGTAKLTVQGE